MTLVLEASKSLPIGWTIFLCRIPMSSKLRSIVCRENSAKWVRSRTTPPQGGAKLDRVAQESLTATVVAAPKDLETLAGRRKLPIKTMTLRQLVNLALWRRLKAFLKRTKLSLSRWTKLQIWKSYWRWTSSKNPPPENWKFRHLQRSAHLC